MEGYFRESVAERVAGMAEVAILSIPSVSGGAYEPLHERAPGRPESKTVDA